MKKKTVILIIVFLLIVAAGGLSVAGLIRKSSLEKQEFSEYSTHCGGGMRGGSSSTTLSAYGERALLTYSESDWYYEDPEVTEYLISREALNEIREIFLKYGMYRWKGKKFSDIFVADGETTSYDFQFSGESISFSSQVYPQAYAKKLEELDRVIGKYSVDGERLPGLVLPERTKEEKRAAAEPENGKVSFSVYMYAQNRLSYRINNGTDQKIPSEKKYTLMDGMGNVIASNCDEETYAGTIYPGSSDENSICLENRLEAGKYTLEVDDMSCDFEIR